MVKPNSEARDVRLAALMEWAQAVIEQSHHVVEKSRKIRSEVEAKRLINSAQNGIGGANGTSSEIEKAAADASE
jgi:hypothetical protein